MSTLQTRLATLASKFADEVLVAIQASSLEEILVDRGGRRGPGRPRAAGAAPARARRAGRLKRRSAEDIQKQLANVVAALKATKKGMRAEEIKARLKLDRREIPRVLAEGLKKKAITRKGQKRATTYFAR
jgi:hypothetical protein